LSRTSEPDAPQRHGAELVACPQWAIRRRVATLLAKGEGIGRQVDSTTDATGEVETMPLRMSAIGAKRTFPYVAFDVAFGGKADMACCSAYVCF